MKPVIIVALILTPAMLFSQAKSVSVSIEQGLTNQVITTQGTQAIKLKKEPFKIIVTLKNLDGVYLFADFTDSIYKLSDNEKIPGFEDLPAMAMAESTFNEDQELIINKEGWAFWFYDKKEDWHRFDKEIKIAGDSVTGTKTIRQFYIPEPKTNIPVTDVKEPLYLFFMAVDKTDKKGMPKEELIRLKTRIDWE